ncbi:unnamed protein product [Cuscuta epithymum]|uniref:Ubiquitin-like protease family profile domain-containing protein n=1 Tax=Cuscuta epithymum TaxID=186058 RepID=A0AAV0D6S7_9ASTE|nr:unnamed protein product [Cuscuta epithymum]
MTKIKKTVFPEEDEIGSSSDGGQCDEDDHSLQNLKIMERMQDMCMCLQRMEKQIDAFEHRVSEMKDLILQLISKGNPSGSDNDKRPDFIPPQEKKEANTMDEQEPSKGDDTILSGEPSTLSCPIHHEVTSADDILTLDVTEDKRADSIPLEEEETNSVDEQDPSMDEEKIWEPSTVARPIHHDHVTCADDILPIVVTRVGEDKFPPLTTPGPFETLDWDGVVEDNGTGVIDVEALEELTRHEVKKRKRFRSKYQCTPYTDPLGKRKKPAGNKNPALLEASDADYASLKAWMEEEDNVVEPSSFILELPSQESVKRAFFQELVEPEEWLSTYHLDSLMYLFAKGMVEKRYELMSPYFVRQHLKKDPGNDKLWCAWVKDKDVTVIEKVFTPFNWEGKHWVLAEIDIVHRVVRVYDSLKSSRTASSVAHLCVRLPYLCRAINCTHTVCESGNMEPWIAKAVNDVPQQEGSSDCGVMVAAFLEALMCDIPLRPYCEYENVHSKRWEFAVRLWRVRRIMA